MGTARELTLTDNGLIRFQEDRSNGTSAVEMKAPAALAGNLTLTLPTALPGSTQFMQSDASGNLSFSAGSSTLDQAYDNGISITVDAGAVALTAGADNTVLAVTQGSGAATTDAMTVSQAGSGDALVLTNSGSGKALDVTAGVAQFAGSVGIGAQAPANELHISAGAADALLQFSNTTTGHTSGDGSLFGIDSSGNLTITQQEALDIVLSTGGTEALRIDDSGDMVGFYQSTPAFKLHVSAATACQIGFTTTATGHLASDGCFVGVNSSSELVLTNNENADIAFSANGSTDWRMQSGGNFGIGVDPAALLHQHQAGATAHAHKLTNGSTGNTSSDGFELGIDTSGNAEVRQKENADLYFYTNDIQVATVTGSGAWTFQNAAGTATAVTVLQTLAGQPTLVASNTNVSATEDVLQVLNAGSGKHIDTDAGAGTPAHLTNSGTWTNASCFKRLKNVIGSFNPVAALEAVLGLEVGVFTHKADRREKPRRYLSVYQDDLVDKIGLGDDGICPQEIASLALSAIQGLAMRVQELESGHGHYPVTRHEVPGLSYVGQE